MRMMSLIVLAITTAGCGGDAPDPAEQADEPPAEVAATEAAETESPGVAAEAERSEYRFRLSLPDGAPWQTLEGHAAFRPAIPLYGTDDGCFSHILDLEPDRVEGLVAITLITTDDSPESLRGTHELHGIAMDARGPEACPDYFSHFGFIFETGDEEGTLKAVPREGTLTVEAVGPDVLEGRIDTDVFMVLGMSGDSIVGPLTGTFRAKPPQW